jgi:hypothetical protein
VGTPYIPQPGIEIDPVNYGQFAGQYGSFLQGPFLYGENLYAVLTFGTGVEIMQSVDFGKTFHAVDSVNQPTNASFDQAVAYFDGKSHVYVAVNLTAGSALTIYTFDLVTLQWSGILSTSTETAFPYAIFKRSDQSIVVISNSATPISGSTFTAAILIAGAWTYVDVGIGIKALLNYDATVDVETPTFAFDGSNIYCFFCATSSSAVGWQNQNCFFSVLTIANTVTKFFTFPGQLAEAVPDLESPEYGPFGVPSLIGATGIVVPVSRNNPSVLPDVSNYPTVYFSNDLGTTWTESTGLGMDPQATTIQEALYPTVSLAQFPPCSFFDGTYLYCVYAQIFGFTPTGQSNFLRLCVCVPAGSVSNWLWNAINVAAISSYPTEEGFSFPSITALPKSAAFNASLFLSTDINDPVFGLLAFWLGGLFPNPGKIQLNPTGYAYGPMPFCVQQSPCKFGQRTRVLF